MFLLLQGYGGSALALTQVHVIETWPPGAQVQLASRQSFYLRLAYDTDVPVHLWVRPFWHGAPADAGVNTSRAYSGRGEALAWFFFLKPDAQVDEVRITAGDGSPAGTHEVAVWRGLVSAGGTTPPAAEPDWLTEMQAQEKVAQRQEQLQRRPPRAAASDALWGMAFTLAVSGMFVLGVGAPAWGLWRWRGGWRLAAAVPAVLMAFVVLRIVVGVARDPTSHNLWPFEILMAGALCVVLMAVLALVRRFRGDRQ